MNSAFFNSFKIIIISYNKKKIFRHDFYQRTLDTKLFFASMSFFIPSDIFFKDKLVDFSTVFKNNMPLIGFHFNKSFISRKTWPIILTDQIQELKMFNVDLRYNIYICIHTIMVD